jgi:hypothetical protein
MACVPKSALGSNDIVPAPRGLDRYALKLFRAHAAPSILQRGIRRSPILSGVDTFRGGRLGFEVLQSHWRWWRSVRVVVYGVWLGTVPVTLAAAWWAERSFQEDSPLQLLVLPVLFAYAGSAAFLFLQRARKAVIYVIPTNLYALTGRLDTGGEIWSKLWFRGEINERLEILASAFELLTPLLQPGDPIAKDGVDRWARGVAARLRSSKLLPPNRYPYLLYEISVDLQMVLNEEWHLLPVIEPPPRPDGPSTINRAVWAGVGIASLTGATLTYSVDLGVLTTPVATLLGVFGLLSLTKAGLASQLLTEARDAIQVLRGTGT